MWAMLARPAVRTWRHLKLSCSRKRAWQRIATPNALAIAEQIDV